MDLLLVDNYDSFTYNIVQAYQCLGKEVGVVRNNLTPLDHIKKMDPRLLVLGPGPGNPQTAGITKGCVLLGLPVFGICLGHQAIAEVFGASIIRASRAMHGKITRIFHNGLGLFSQLPQGFNAVRYNSLIVQTSSLPSCLVVTAWTEEEEIMGIQHKELPIAGVQFHPESVASHEGTQLFKNSLLL